MTALLVAGALGCTILLEEGRQVIQPIPLMERVTTIEWCAREGWNDTGGHLTRRGLERNTRTFYEGQELVNMLGSVQLWPPSAAE